MKMTMDTDIRSKIDSEFIFRIILLVLGFVITIVSLGYGFGSLAQPGPGLYTFLLGASLLIFSLIHIFSPKKPKEREALFSNNHEIKKFIWMGGIFIFWIIGMPYLGYAIISFVATFFISKVIELEGWLKPLILSLATSTFIYLLFDYFLYIDLPRGILG
jgi:putative tricarboxylic transport membrane protein